MALTFIKDAPLYRLNVVSVAGTFVVGEFFIDDNNSLKVGEVIAVATDEYGSISSIDYILVGSSAVQFADTDTFGSQCTTGGTGGTGIIDGTPTIIGFHHVHVIQVDLPATQVTIQELVNEIRDYEDELSELDHLFLANATGKQDLGGGVLVGITLELLDNWRVQFEPRTGPLTVQVSVTGGNIVSTNDFSNNPIKASPYTQVQVTSASSATIAELQIIDLVHRIESLRDSHGRFGSIIYWDPIGGADDAAGDSPGRAVLTFAAAHTLASADVGDVIQCLTRSAITDTVEVDEAIEITKNGVSIRGPGEQFVFKHGSGAGANHTIHVHANNVELSGFLIEHDFAGALTAIHVDGSLSASGSSNNTSLKNIIIRSSNSHSVLIGDAGDCEILNLFIEDSGGDGIRIGDNVDDLRITGCIIDRAATYAVNVNGTGILDTILERNQLHDSGLYAIRIGPGSNQTTIRSSNFFFDNIVGNILEETGAQNITIEQDQLDKPIEDVKASIEALRPHHTAQGRTIYWDPVDGNDNNTGLVPKKPVKTFTQAHSIVNDGAHEVIFALASQPANTVVTETITISKNYLFLRGPGRNFIFRPSGDAYGVGVGIDTITITGTGVEVSSFAFENNDTTANYAVKTTGDFTLIKDCWFEASGKNAIDIEGDFSIVEDCNINNHIENGILIQGAVNRAVIRGNLILNTDSDGVFIDVALSTDIVIEDNRILNSDGFGINITNGSAVRTSIRKDNFMFNNILGNIDDNGTNTAIEPAGGGAEAWDEIISDHTVADSFGKKLTDTLKLKRTRP